MPPKKRGRPGETGAQQEAQPSGAATVAPRRRHTRVQRWHGSTQHEITRGVAGVLKELGARLEKEQAALVKEARRQHKGSKPFDAAAEVEALVRRVEQLALGWLTWLAQACGRNDCGSRMSDQPI